MKRVVLIALYILFHILFLREVRNVIFSAQINDTFLERIELSTTVHVEKLDIRLINFRFKEGDFQKVWHYKITFGSFFFLAMIALISLNSETKLFVILAGMHVTVIIISSLIFHIGTQWSFALLAVPDLLSRYIIPLVSLGLIPIAYIQNRQKTIHEGHA